MSGENGIADILVPSRRVQLIARQRDTTGCHRELVVSSYPLAPRLGGERASCLWKTTVVRCSASQDVQVSWRFFMRILDAERRATLLRRAARVRGSSPAPRSSTWPDHRSGGARTGARGQEEPLCHHDHQLAIAPDTTEQSLISGTRESILNILRTDLLNLCVLRVSVFQSFTRMKDRV